MPASDTSSPNIHRRTKDVSLPDKSQIEKWNRSKLEENYLETAFENAQLKRRLNEQEDQLKKQQRTRNLLATKLLKLSKGQAGVGPSETTGGDGRQNVDLAEIHNYIFELEQQNTLLRDKLKSAKYQLNAYTRFPLAPGPGQRFAGNVSGRTSRGTGRHTCTAIQASSPSGKVDSFAIGPVDNALLRQAEDTIGKQRQQLAIYEADLAALKQQLQIKDASFGDELTRLQGQITSDQRLSTNENIEVIRMQKIIRDQANEISVLQVRCNKHEGELRQCKSQYQNSVTEIDQLKAKLHTEQTQTSQLQMELRSSRCTYDGTVMKLNQEIETFKRENEILKEGSDRMLASAFNVEREKQWEATERALRGQIMTLEGAVKADATTRNELLEKLANEMTAKDDIEQQLRKLQIQNVQLKADIEHVQQKLNKLTTAQGVEFSEIEEAIAYIRQKKKTGEGVDLTIPDFVTQLPPDEGVDRDAKDQLAKLQLTFAEAVQELEKTRNMLLIQYKINQDYKAETEAVSQKSDRLKEEYERKVKEYSQMLDDRALRIQKLERQLYDVAYGTRAPRPEPKGDETAPLEPGRNLLELHLSEIKLTEDALRLMQSLEPTTFMTVEFYDFEIRFTPMLQGSRVPMDFTCQYDVMVNDLFLHYMQTECALVELHQVIGSNYKTWAAGKIYLKDILSQSEGRYLGRAELLGISADAVMVSFGEVKFSVHLRVPAERALRFYKSRVKSLGYLVEGHEVHSEKGRENQLNIHIHRCRDLKPGREGDPPPSAYAAYQFYEFPDHDSKVVPANSNPELADHIAWPVIMDKSLDHYLKNQTLRIYVLDDSAEDDLTAYIGHVDIPLLPLARNKPLNGTFRIKNADSECTGSMDVSLNWQFAYIPPTDSTIFAEPMIPLGPSADIPLSRVEPGESNIADRKPVNVSAMLEGDITHDQTTVIIDHRARSDHQAPPDRQARPDHQAPPVTEGTSDGARHDEQPRPILVRSATFDKLPGSQEEGIKEPTEGSHEQHSKTPLDEYHQSPVEASLDESLDQPLKASRRTWEKKIPMVPPRRGKTHEAVNGSSNVDGLSELDSEAKRSDLEDGNVDRNESPDARLHQTPDHKLA